MITHPPAPTLAKPLSDNERRVLEDVFSHVVSHDREVQTRYRTITETLDPGEGKSTRSVTLKPLDAVQLSDLVVELMGEISDLCAATAPAALERARMLGILPASEAVHNLSIADASDFVRPIFEEAGIADRFVESLHREARDE